MEPAVRPGVNINTSNMHALRSIVRLIKWSWTRREKALTRIREMRSPATSNIFFGELLMGKSGWKKTDINGVYRNRVWCGNWRALRNKLSSSKHLGSFVRGWVTSSFEATPGTRFQLWRSCSCRWDVSWRFWLMNQEACGEVVVVSCRAI